MAFWNSVRQIWVITHSDFHRYKLFEVVVNSEITQSFEKAGTVMLCQSMDHFYTHLYTNSTKFQVNTLTHKKRPQFLIFYSEIDFHALVIALILTLCCQALILLHFDFIIEYVWAEHRINGLTSDIWARKFHMRSLEWDRNRLCY